MSVVYHHLPKIVGQVNTKNCVYYIYLVLLDAAILKSLIVFLT